jgi:hypothetical protein
MNEQLRATASQVVPPMNHGTGVFMSVFLPLAAVVGAIVFVAWILAMFSLLTQHSIFGWGLPHGIPVWVGVVALVLIYLGVSAPRKALRHGGQQPAHHVGFSALYGLIWIGCTALLFWAAYHYFPGVRELVDNLVWAANLTATTISETIA